MPEPREGDRALPGEPRDALLAATTDEWERASVIAARVGRTGDRVGSELAMLERHGSIEARLDEPTDRYEYRLAPG